MNERLVDYTPTEDGHVSEGEYVMTVRVTVDHMGVLIHHNAERSRQADWWTNRGAAWQRVVRDPELPDAPGSIIRCEIRQFPGREKVGIRETADMWLIAGVAGFVRDADITRVIAVVGRVS